jgi:hypothetical protein
LVVVLSLSDYAHRLLQSQMLRRTFSLLIEKNRLSMKVISLLVTGLGPLHGRLSAVLLLSQMLRHI